MSTLVSLEDAIYSLGYWIGAAHAAAAGSNDATTEDKYGIAYGTNLVANMSVSSTSSYTGVKASEV